MNGWVQELTKHTQNNYKILIGAKSDLERNRQVEKTEAQKWADDNNIPMFIEVSSKNRINIQELIYGIANQFCESDKALTDIIGLKL